MIKKNVILVLFLLIIAIPVLFCTYTIIEKNIIEYGMEKKLSQERIQTITLEA